MPQPGAGQQELQRYLAIVRELGFQVKVDDLAHVIHATEERDPSLRGALLAEGSLVSDQSDNASKPFEQRQSSDFEAIDGARRGKHAISFDPAATLFDEILLTPIGASLVQLDDYRIAANRAGVKISADDISRRSTRSTWGRQSSSAYEPTPS